MEPHDRTAERAHPYYYPRMLYLQNRKAVDYRVERNGNGNGNHNAGDHRDLTNGNGNHNGAGYRNLMLPPNGNGNHGSTDHRDLMEPPNGNGNHSGAHHREPMEPQVRIAERAHAYYYPRILYFRGCKVGR
jgi:hypothetical protein